jgi:hypothetical protein
MKELEFSIDDTYMAELRHHWTQKVNELLEKCKFMCLERHVHANSYII